MLHVNKRARRAFMAVCVLMVGSVFLLSLRSLTYSKLDNDVIRGMTNHQETTESSQQAHRGQYFIIMCRLKQRRNRPVLCDKTKCKCSISLWSLRLRLAIEMSNAHRVGFSCFNGIASTESRALAGRLPFFGRTGNLS